MFDGVLYNPLAAGHRRSVVEFFRFAGVGHPAPAEASGQSTSGGSVGTPVVKSLRGSWLKEGKVVRDGPFVILLGGQQASIKKHTTINNYTVLFAPVW